MISSKNWWNQQVISHLVHIKRMYHWPKNWNSTISQLWKKRGSGTESALMGKTVKNTPWQIGLRYLIFTFCFYYRQHQILCWGNFRWRKTRKLFWIFVTFSSLVFFSTKFSLNRYYFSLMISWTKQRSKRNTWHLTHHLNTNLNLTIILF